jgi:phosphoribosylformylglycinamidine cyclo-ligase
MLYRDAGVDIDAATEAKASIKLLARKTFNARVLKEVGAFGGFFSIKGLPRDAVLISSIDGVGTKLKIAFALNRHTTVGTDMVNHCVNDISVHGAAPLFLLDYLATGKMHPAVVTAVVTDVVRGVASACRSVGCALIGGETAEMPGFYPPNEYDLAACIIGWVRQRPAARDHRRQPHLPGRRHRGPSLLGTTHERIFPGTQGPARKGKNQAHPTDTGTGPDPG